MNFSYQKKKRNVFLLIIGLFLAFTVGAENHDINQEPHVGTVTSNGSVIEGTPITFMGTCQGENTQLVVCQENTICSTQSNQEDIICSSEFTDDAEKECVYITTKEDLSIHNNDIATCCNGEGICDSNVVAVPPWMVLDEQATSQIIILDDEDNLVPATVTQQDTETDIIFINQPITKLQFSVFEGNKIGLSQATRGIIPPEGIEFAKVYSLDVEEVNFTEATLYALAQGASLYLCKFWDFTLSTCVGSWDVIKNIEPNTEYTFNLQKGSFGFAEAITEAQPAVQPVIEQPPEEPVKEPVVEEPIIIEEPVPEINIEGPITNNGPVEQGQEIIFSGICKSNQPTQVVICRDNIVCNAETSKENVLCTSVQSPDERKSCAYSTTTEDIGENVDSIATCCTTEGSCAAETKSLESWAVTAPLKIIQEEIKESEEDIQEPAEINKPVHWKKKIKLKQDMKDLTVTIPSTSTNITILKRENELLQELQTEQWSLLEKEKEKEITINIPVNDVELDYVTEPPQVSESELSPHKKQVTVSSDLSYTNITSYTIIPETPEKKLRLFWMVNESRQPVDNVRYLDTNGDRLIDRIEWFISHLSNQTYEVIMVTKADHLDENKVFLSDVYNEVKQLDNVWSETIPETHYVQVTFGTPLTARHDISIYPRIVGGNPKIIVYEVNQSEVLAEFSTITANQYNKVFLENLNGTQETFDLQILNGAVEFDHIVDPTLTISNITTLCGEVTAYDTIVVTETGELEICLMNGTGTNSNTGFVNITLGSVGNFSVAAGGIVNGTGGGAEGGAGTNSGCATQGDNGQNYTNGVALCSPNGGGGGGGSDATSTAETAGGGGGGFGGAGGTGGKSATGGTVGAAGGTYGDAEEQELNTSGSGGGGSSDDAGVRGGSGGAGFRVDAGSGEINIQGTINVSGEDGTDAAGNADRAGAGGGSGGHVILIAKKLNLNAGAIYAEGGRGGNGGTTADGCGGGGGGGGRIVYVYDNITEDSLINSTDGGDRGNSPDTGPCAALPTLGTNGTVFYNQSTFADLSPPIADPNSIVFDPINETNYTLTQFYEFNATWTDDVEVDNVFITFNETNYSFAKGEVYNSSETPTVFSFNQTGLAAAEYNYTWFANDSSNNENQTDLQFGYIVARAEPEVNLTLNDTINNITIIVSDAEVNHSASLITGDSEATVQILQDGVAMVTEGASPTISNVTNYTATGTYNITVLYQTSENYTTNFTTLFVEVTAAAGGNTAPVVEAIDGPGGNTISSQSVTEDGITDLGVTFTITDAEGVTDLNATEINITLFNTTYITTDVNYFSQNTSCDNINNISSTQANFTCNIEINYWYTAGEWNLTVGATDIAGASSENATNISIGETTAIVIDLTSLTFPQLILGAENTTSDNDPITINNTANDYIDQNNTRVTGLDLVGEVTDTQAITTENFTVSESTGETPPVECSNIGDNLNNSRLINNTAINVNMSILSSGNRSIAGEGVEQLYVCIPIVPDGLLPQAYSTLNGTTGWTVSVV
ncbi:hypothetical protein HYS50_01440 [Candidatus Woesearchaeota archaeon]|nr:hypothetical protein [Candidatus Woesearchaeota archaeon]